MPGTGLTFFPSSFFISLNVESSRSYMCILTKFFTFPASVFTNCCELCMASLTAERTFCAVAWCFKRPPTTRIFALSSCGKNPFRLPTYTALHLVEVVFVFKMGGSSIPYIRKHSVYWCVVIEMLLDFGEGQACMGRVKTRVVADDGPIPRHLS